MEEALVTKYRFTIHRNLESVKCFFFLNCLIICNLAFFILFFCDFHFVI